MKFVRRAARVLEGPGSQLELEWGPEYYCRVKCAMMVFEGGLPGFGLGGGGDLPFDGGSTVDLAEFCVAGMLAQDIGFVAFCWLRSAGFLKGREMCMLRVGISQPQISQIMIRESSRDSLLHTRDRREL